MVTIRVCHDDGANQLGRLPSYEAAGAAEADVCVNLPDRGLLTPGVGERTLMPTMLRLEIPNGYEVHNRPCSGLMLKHGTILHNMPGTIDSDYREPLGVILMNTGKQAFVVAHGDRIAQMCGYPRATGPIPGRRRPRDTEPGAGGFRSQGMRLMLLLLALGTMLWSIGTVINATG
ncbi:MAG: dUTP diphosphatase [Rhodobacteraceae bacterium]|nr:dUTP diphosphatase [Paracoccaceae bacterium]